MPGTRPEYWGPKLARNVERDAANEEALAALGWSLIVVWECEVSRPGFLADLAQRVKAMPLRR